MNGARVGLLALGLVAVPVAGCGYNAIPTKQERAEAAWADVQSQYQRRADLIPNLVATVQAAAVQERATLTQVTEARARATAVTVTPETLNDPAAFQRYQAAQGELSQALSRLLMVVESYPQLQANQNFLTLQVQLEGTENRINIARRDYNEAVRELQADGATASRRELHRHDRAFPHARFAGPVQNGRHPDRRRRPPRDDPGRLDQARCNGHRRRHQPRSRA